MKEGREPEHPEKTPDDELQIAVLFRWGMPGTLVALVVSWLLNVQGRTCSDSCPCCHIEIEVADQTISPSHNILTPGQPVPAPTL